MDQLVSIAQACRKETVVGQMEPTAVERQIERLTEEIKELKTEVKGNLSKKLQERAQNRRRRCFLCHRMGHFARDCPDNRLKSCFSLSSLSFRGVPRIPVSIRGTSTIAVIDTGAGVSVMPKIEGVPVRPCDLGVRAVGGMRLEVLGKQCVDVQIGEVTVTHEMLLIEGVSEVILGVDLLRRVGAKIDLTDNKLRVGPCEIELCPASIKSSVGRMAASAVPECPIPCVKQCIERYSELFSTPDDEYGFCDWLEHKIELIPGSVCRPVYRRIPQKLLPEVERQVREMLAKGIIRKSASPY